MAPLVKWLAQPVSSSGGITNDGLDVGVGVGVEVGVDVGVEEGVGVGEGSEAISSVSHILFLSLSRQQPNPTLIYGSSHASAWFERV